MSQTRPARIEGMYIVIENGDLRGLKNCGDDLKRRGLPAVVTIGEAGIDKNPSLVRDLSNSGLEIGGKIGPEFLGDEPYESQLAEARRVQDKIRQCTNKPMRAITGRHFLHNDAMVRVAHELGLSYVLVRGNSGAKAVVYKAKEYAPKIVAISMTQAKGAGVGSVCEHIPWATGQTPEDFGRLLFGLKERKMTVGIHTSLGGMKLRWWNIYQDFFNANLVTWKSLEEFARKPVVVPYAQIPRDSEITYSKPTPRMPLEQEPKYQPKE